MQPAASDAPDSRPDQETIRQLEEASFRAWPALRSERQGGWLLRFANGHTKRANSVNVLEPGSAHDLDARITRAEARYAAAGQPTIFRLSPLAEPELDARLAGRGYTAFDHSLVMVASGPGPTTEHDGVILEPSPEGLWFEGFCAYSPVATNNRDNLRTMLACVQPPVCYASMAREGERVAFGMSVVEGSKAGFFEILVAPAWRGKGLGRAILETLMSWASKEAGVDQFWLQVLADNSPATALYTSLGFRTVYSYRYRMPVRAGAGQ